MLDVTRNEKNVHEATQTTLSIMVHLPRVAYADIVDISHVAENIAAEMIETHSWALRQRIIAVSTTLESLSFLR